MKSVKTTVAFALMLLLATGLIACKKSEEAVVAPVEQAAPAPEVVVAPQAEPGASTVVVVPPTEQAAPAPAAAPEAAPAAK